MSDLPSDSWINSHSLKQTASIQKSASTEGGAIRDAIQEAMRLALQMLVFVNDNGYRLEDDEQERMDAAIAALERVVK